VYALGALLVALVERPGERLPRALAAIAAHARAPARNARYADAGALAADVRRFVAGEAVTALPEGPFARTWRLARRHQVAIGLVLAYVAMRIALGIWSSG
jgi:eukaryotic-like serine/threonine-protein kinase